MAFKTKLRSVLMSGVNLIVAHRRMLIGMAIAFLACAMLVAACAGCGPKIVLPQPTGQSAAVGDNIVASMSSEDRLAFGESVFMGKIPPKPANTFLTEEEWQAYVRSKTGFGMWSNDRPAKPEKPNDTGQSAINDISRTLGWVAGICTLLSALACVASVFVPVIPRKSALLALGISIGIGLMRVVVISYGLVTAHVAFWASVAALIVAAITVAWPMAVAWRNALLLRTSKQLEEKGDSRAAVALKVAAAPSMLPTKEDRKAAVVEIEMKGRP